MATFSSVFVTVYPVTSDGSVQSAAVQHSVAVHGSVAHVIPAGEASMAFAPPEQSNASSAVPSALMSAHERKGTHVGSPVVAAPALASAAHVTVPVPATCVETSHFTVHVGSLLVLNTRSTVHPSLPVSSATTPLPNVYAVQVFSLQHTSKSPVLTLQAEPMHSADVAVPSAVHPTEQEIVEQAPRATQVG